MRVMVDTNVLISAFLFPSDEMTQIFDFIFTEGNTLVLPEYVIGELRFVGARKFPKSKEIIERIISEMEYELFYAPDILQGNLHIEMRDPKDLPVIYSAVYAGVDVLVTGDKDFADLKIARPEILTPKRFFEKYASPKNNSH